MTMLARAFAPRAVKSIDQSAMSGSQNGVYIRLDDRSVMTSQFYDAQSQALSMSTVYACVRVLAEAVAQLPLMIYRPLPNGGKERASDHRWYEALHDQVSPSLTSFDWRELMMSNLLTWGNHDSLIVPDEFDRPRLYPIRPDRMEYRWASDGTRRFFYLSPAGTRTELDPATVFHVAGLSSNGLSGLSPIALHAKTLRLAETTLEFGTSFFANNARPAIVLSHPGNVSPDGISRLAGQFDELRGSRNSGKTVILEEGLTVTEVGVPPEDAQYIETRKLQQKVIASQIFKVPPHMIGDLESGASYASIEQMSLEFVTYVLMPWLRRIESQINAQLLLKENVSAEFLVDGLLRGDAKSRAEALAIRWQHGTLTADEWRALENENPLPDEIGKQTYVAVNYAPATVPAPAVLPAVNSGNPPQLVAVKSQGRFDCPDCGKLVGRQGVPGISIGFCRHCKAEKTMGPIDAPISIETARSVRREIEYDTAGRVRAVTEVSA